MDDAFEMWTVKQFEWRFFWKNFNIKNYMITKDEATY